MGHGTGETCMFPSLFLYFVRKVIYPYTSNYKNKHSQIKLWFSDTICLGIYFGVCDIRCNDKEMLNIEKYGEKKEGAHTSVHGW